MDCDDMHEKLRDSIAERAAATFGEIESGLLTRWLMVAETVGPDGERGVWVLKSKDMISWEFLGLLDHARTIAREDLVADDEDE